MDVFFFKTDKQLPSQVDIWASFNDYKTKYSAGGDVENMGFYQIVTE